MTVVAIDPGHSDTVISVLQDKIPLYCSICHYNLEKTANEICDIFSRYAATAIVIDSNGIGIALVDYLLKYVDAAIYPIKVTASINEEIEKVAPKKKMDYASKLGIWWISQNGEDGL